LHPETTKQNAIMKKEYVDVCPFCGSENIEWMGDAFGDETPYHCHECDRWFSDGNDNSGKKRFQVSVIGCNAATFFCNFEDYVIDQVPSYYDNMVFTLEASQEVYDAIEDLKEEGIEIIK